MTLPDSIEKLPGLRRNGADWLACCPCHDDGTPSLAVRIADDGMILVRCHAGCDQRDVATALGLTGNHDRGEWTPRGEAVAVYDYRDESGQLLFQVLRTATKDFPQRAPDPGSKTGWRWNLRDVRRVPFRLPELIEAIANGSSVCITEGEKDALALVAQGHVATCNPGGAGKWLAEYAQHFAGAKVTIFADKDEPGQKHARQVAATLKEVADEVWIVEAADPHKDIAAHLGAGLAMSEVLITHRPDQPAYVSLAPTIQEILDEELPDYDWIVPSLLERGERVMITGFEGLGKSMMLRMFAVCFACGVNPVTFENFEPIKVLYVDCENSKAQVRRGYRALVEHAAHIGRPVKDGHLRIDIRPNGLDLAREDDATWLVERVTAHKPDVLIIGPLYQLHTDNPSDETTARKLTMALNAARVASKCAILLEAHAGHGEWGKNRSVRPVGSSLYLRWPEFGFGIRPTQEESDKKRPEVVHSIQWRFDRDDRNWPAIWEHGHRQGSGWPWVPGLNRADYALVPDEHEAAS